MLTDYMYSKSNCDVSIIVSGIACKKMIPNISKTCSEGYHSITAVLWAGQTRIWNGPRVHWIW